MRQLTQAIALLIVAAVPVYAGGISVTPEPATITLVATGAGVLGVAAWIRRRRK
jgi:hypothetical protein